MTQAFFHTTCPSCGAPVEAHSATAVTLVCGYCRSTLVRSGSGVDTTGRNSALLEDFSPLQIGTTGVYNNRAFTLRGRLQVQYDSGMWNEWYIVFADGSQGWLSESGDRYVLTWPLLQKIDALPEFSDISAGYSKLQLNDFQFVAADVREVELLGAAAEGELPFRLPEPKTKSRVSDWRCNHLFLTVDYGSGDGEPECFFGAGVRLADLQLDHLRSDEETVQAAGRLKGQTAAENCPNCGGNLTWPQGLATHLVCPSCHSEIAVDGGKLKLLQANNMRQAQDYANTLELGMMGKIDGLRYRVIGVLHQQEYSAQNDFTGGGLWLPEASSWTEYLLYHPRGGFVWLVETSDRKWYRAETLDTWPRLNADNEPVGAKPLDAYHGKVSYAAGAFYWHVRAGDATLYRDYVTSNGILSAAITANEMAWTLQRPMKINDVYQAFKLTEKLPENVRESAWGHRPGDPESGYRKRHAVILTVIYLIFNLLPIIKHWDSLDVGEIDWVGLMLLHLGILYVIWLFPKDED